MSKKILVVDDEKKIVNVVRGYLEQAGFRHCPRITWSI